jgi:hypothetical protein
MKQVFEMVPPSGSGFPFVAGILLAFFAGMLVFFAYLFHGSSRVRFEVSEAGLSVNGLYGRHIARADLELERAAGLDLTADREHGLAWRTNGVGMPGYQAGWFRLKNGEKALVFVTDKRRVAYIPTRRGYSVLLSVASPSDFLAALRRPG